MVNHYSWTVESPKLDAMYVKKVLEAFIPYILQ